MAVTYKWDIPQMNAHVQADGQDHVIYTVHYRYTGSEESGGVTYSSTNIGTQSYTYVAGESFTPYENTEARRIIRCTSYASIYCCKHSISNYTHR